MDKAPDAFRTISEVADDLDIPQHVLRFWETRFAQIKPMKRSGGRRYYRPDDVDLLRGIRRLLYGEGYTIRGVQKILKEQGVKAVQALADGAPLPSVQPARSEEARRPAESAALPEEPAEDDADYDEDLDADAAEETEEVVERREPDITRSRQPTLPLPELHSQRATDRAEARPTSHGQGLDAASRERLEEVLDDLIACRELLDETLKERPGPPVPE